MRSENHPFYLTRPNQEDDIRKTFGFNDIKAWDTAVDVLASWCKQQSHFLVKDLGRDYLEAYIITSKGSLEKAKKRLDKRCTLPHLMPEIFNNIRIETEFKSLLKSYNHAVMPLATKDLYRVVIEKYYNEPHDFDFLQFARFKHVCAEYSLMNELVVGFEVIIDMYDVSIADFIGKVNIMLLQKLMIMLIDGYGAKLRALHMVNSSKFIDTIVSLIKQGMSEKMANRIQIHTSYDTLLKLLPKESLPSDYGGTGPSISEAHSLLFKDMCSERFLNRMKQIATYGTDETKRISGKFNEEYMGMPGSFRTLSVD